MTDDHHPYKRMSDATATALDRIFNAQPDVTDASAGQKLVACQALISVIETGVKIAGDFMRTGKEPYPGAALDVVSHTQRAIDLARLSRLVPPKGG